jgi:hypothetical protein
MEFSMCIYTFQFDKLKTLYHWSVVVNMLGQNSTQKVGFCSKILLPSHYLLMNAETWITKCFNLHGFVARDGTSKSVHVLCKAWWEESGLHGHWQPIPIVINVSFAPLLWEPPFLFSIQLNKVGCYKLASLSTTKCCPNQVNRGKTLALDLNLKWSYMKLELLG